MDNNQTNYVSNIFLGLLLLFGGIALIYTSLHKSAIQINSTNITKNLTQEITPGYYQKLVLLVKYNKTECPNLKVNHTNPATNISEVLEIKTVKNITKEINYVELGRYDTNNPSIQPIISWIDYWKCYPQALLVTNNEFLEILVSYGIPIDNATVTPIDNNTEKFKYPNMQSL
jgi:hypothetical protein